MMKINGTSSWHKLLERLDEETTMSSEDAFSRGDIAWNSKFIVDPIRGFLQGLVESRSDRLVGGIIAGYRRLVHITKLWELDRIWRERETHIDHRNKVDVLYRREWGTVAGGIFSGNFSLSSLPGGRGGTLSADTSQGRLILRNFRRGGAMRWAHDLYFGLHPRPFVEFWLLMNAHRCGLPVPEPVAAEVRHLIRGIYRGSILMREVPEAQTLAEGLCQEIDMSLADMVGRAVRKLFDAGLWHDDLNLSNVLITPQGVVFVDFDRARFFSGPLSERRRRAMLARFRRSGRRYDGISTIQGAQWFDRMEAACREC